MARMTLEEIRNRASTVDRDKVEATTEAEIEAHRAADGDTDLDVSVDAQIVESPRAIRVRLGMTQPEIAAALRIPLGTWRNWEQGRVSLEPAAAALLRVVSHSAETALAALASSGRKPDAPVLKAYVGPKLISNQSEFLFFLDQVVCAQAGREFGKSETPRVRQFTELSQDPDVRAWLTEREQARAKPTSHD